MREAVPVGVVELNHDKVRFHVEPLALPSATLRLLLGRVKHPVEVLVETLGENGYASGLNLSVVGRPSAGGPREVDEP